VGEAFAREFPFSIIDAFRRARPGRARGKPGSPIVLLNSPEHILSFGLALNIVKRFEDRSGFGSPLQLEQLVRRTSRADATAFAMLYRQSAPKLFGIALRIVGNRDEAEEVLQESFVAVWQRAGDYDVERGSAAGWLVTIVRHCAIDHLRRRARRPEGRKAPDELLTSLASGDRGADRSAELDALQRCLGELDEQPRRAILLAYLYGFTREEIAVALAAPVGTVKSWLRRGTERLKRCLDP